jgi:hypothetical protein
LTEHRGIASAACPHVTLSGLCQSAVSHSFIHSGLVTVFTPQVLALYQYKHLMHFTSLSQRYAIQFTGIIVVGLQLNIKLAGFGN